MVWKQRHYPHHRWNWKCSSPMHFAANHYSSPLVVSGGNGAVHSSCPRQITSFSLALRWVHFLDILQPRNTVTTFFLVTFSLKVFVTCVAVWNGVFPIALNVALLYLASPSVLVNMLASPHFSLKSWMSCLFSSYCVCLQVYWMLVPNANSMFV